MENIIETHDLRFSYKSENEEESSKPAEEVLKGIDLKIKPGEFIAVLGHNGSGKSTLAKHLNGILVPDSGKVLVDGIDTADNSKIFEIRQRAGMVFQNPDNQIVSSIVEEDVAFALENLHNGINGLCDDSGVSLRNILFFCVFHGYNPPQLIINNKKRPQVSIF